MEEPQVVNVIDDHSVMLKLTPASEKHGKISHYLIIVLIDEMAREIDPEHIKLSDVSPSVLKLYKSVKQNSCVSYTYLQNTHHRCPLKVLIFTETSIKLNIFVSCTYV